MEAYTPKLCAYTDCNKEGTKRCGRCESARYCSTVCQTKHYPKHRESCLRLEERKKEKSKIGKGGDPYEVGVTQQDYSRMVNTIKKGDILLV